MAAGQLTVRVRAAAERVLEAKKNVSPVDVLLALGWLVDPHVTRWRQGRVECLEELIQADPRNVAAAIRQLRQWAIEKGLHASEGTYVARTRDRRTLRFTTSGNPDTERIYRTHWVSRELSERKRESVEEKINRPPDLVVVWATRDWVCHGCGAESDGLLMMEDGGPLCMSCVDMDHLVFLPAGEAALTRRAKKASRLSAVVVRWSRSRRRYERQGILVEEAALVEAEQQCLADADARSRQRLRDEERRAQEDLEYQDRLAAEIIHLFPGCPNGRAAAIARHTGTRGSGRVGRTSASRKLDPTAIELAVIASIRHEDTDYDDLLMAGYSREAARAAVRGAVHTILETWRRS